MENISKENFFSLHNIPLETQSLKRVMMPPGESQQSKLRNKPVKSTSSNIRAGDWICLICQNLNFSFRDECNRCQMQTKKQNYVQGLLYGPDSQSLRIHPGDRPPLQDLTNYSNYDHEMGPQQAGLAFFSTQKYSKGEPATESVSKSTSPSDTFEANEKDNFDFSSNYGFENVLLLTPPRATKKAEPLDKYSDCCQEEFPAYRSPKQLPSVSSILREVVSEKIEKASKFSVKAGFSEVNSNMSTTLGETQAEWDNKFQNPLEYYNCLKTKLEDRLLDDQEFDLSRIDFSIDEDLNNPICLPKDKKMQSFPVSVNNNRDSGIENQRRNKPLKQDWVCVNCGNLNYSFRKFCNRCQMLK